MVCLRGGSSVLVFMIEVFFWGDRGISFQDDLFFFISRVILNAQLIL